METVRFPRLTFDRQALELVVLFAVVLGATAAIAAQFQPEQAASISPPDTFGEGTQGEAGAAVALTLAEVAFAGTLLLVLLAYNRLPEWVQDLVKTNAFIAAFLFIGAHYGPRIGTGPIVGAAVGMYTAYKALDQFGLYWLLNNLFTVAIAICYGVVLGMLFGVVGMGIALVGLTAYDHLFANKRPWMMQLGKGMVNLGLPVLFVRPESLQLAWEDLVEMFDGDDEEPDPDSSSWGLGTADMMLPAGFVAAVVTTPTDALLVGGVLAGVVCIAGALVACCRIRFEMLSRGSGAGLPALSTGVLVPYAALAVVGLLV